MHFSRLNLFFFFHLSLSFPFLKLFFLQYLYQNTHQGSFFLTIYSPSLHLKFPLGALKARHREAGQRWGMVKNWQDVLIPWTIGQY